MMSRVARRLGPRDVGVLACIAVGCVAVGCVTMGCGGAQRPAASLPEVTETSAWDALVVEAQGAVPAHTGETCRVEVGPAEEPYFNCRLRVRCGDETVYGLPGAGFNRCRVRDGKAVFAEDAGDTRRDGDSKMLFDLDELQVVVRDRDPDVKLVLALPSSAHGEGPPAGQAPTAPPGYGTGEGVYPDP